MNFKRVQRLLVWLIFPALIGSGCSWSVDTELTELAVAQFHQSYNKGSYRSIFINASPEFQDFITEDKFTRLLQKLHNGLGQHQSSSRISWKANSSISTGTTITLVYEAVYDKDDQARETFTYKVKDGFAKLYNFNVSSKVLAGKKAPKVTEV